MLCCVLFKPKCIVSSFINFPIASLNARGHIKSQKHTTLRYLEQRNIFTIFSMNDAVFLFWYILYINILCTKCSNLNLKHRNIQKIRWIIHFKQKFFILECFLQRFALLLSYPKAVSMFSARICIIYFSIRNKITNSRNLFSAFGNGKFFIEMTHNYPKTERPKPRKHVGT